MCCMYSCLCRGSKRQKLATECFIHCLLRSGGFKMWSSLCVLVCMYGRDPVCGRKCHSNADDDLSGYFKHEIVRAHTFTHWWKLNETFSLRGSLRWLLLFIKEFVFIPLWGQRAVESWCCFLWQKITCLLHTAGVFTDEAKRYASSSVWDARSFQLTAA